MNTLALGLLGLARIPKPAVVPARRHICRDSGAWVPPDQQRDDNPPGATMAPSLLRALAEHGTLTADKAAVLMDRHQCTAHLAANYCAADARGWVVFSRSGNRRAFSITDAGMEHLRGLA
jgi:hypothetical protein